MAAARGFGSSWHEIVDRYGVGEQTARSWASTDMKQGAKHERRRRSGHLRKLREAEDLEIPDWARARRAEHGIVDRAWTRAMIADVTQGRFPAVPDGFISRFWGLARGSIDAEFLLHQRQVTRKVGGETLVVQKAVSWMGTSQILSWTQRRVGRWVNGTALTASISQCNVPVSRWQHQFLLQKKNCDEALEPVWHDRDFKNATGPIIFQ
jgi:hypothetical protein